MVYGAKAGIIATASLAGTALTTYTSGGFGGSSTNNPAVNSGIGNNSSNGSSRSTSEYSYRSSTSSGLKHSDTMKQMHFWK